MPLTFPTGGFKGFRWSHQPDGSFVIYDVPIFCECERDDMVYDVEYIQDAFAGLRQAELDGHLPPVHMRHHGDGEKPVFVGMMRATRVGPLAWKGSTKQAIFADISVQDPEVFAHIQARRLPYRSVEAYSDEPRILSLALLDTEAPYLELPMTMLAADVTNVTNTSFRVQYVGNGRSPVVAFGVSKDRTTIVMEAQPMPDDEKKTSEEKDDEKVQMQSGDGPDVKAVVKAIKNGSISIADFADIKAAMSEAEAGVEEGDEESHEPSDEPANPEGEPEPLAMKAEVTARMAALEGRISRFEAERKQERAVMRALHDLDDYSYGADPEAKIRKVIADAGNSWENALKVFCATIRETAPKCKTTSHGRSVSDAADSEWPEEVQKVATSPEEGAAALKAFRAFEQRRQIGLGRTESFKAYWQANRVHFGAPVK